MFIPVTFLGTMSTDLGCLIETIISIGKIVDKSNAKVSLVLDKVNSKKYYLRFLMMLKKDYYYQMR